MNPTSLSPFVPTHMSPIMFIGKPSQAIHVPLLATTLLILVACLAAAFMWRMPWWLSTLPGLVASLMLGLRALATACTVVAIDAERLTLREGVLTKTTSSVELFRMLDVTLVQPWWQRLLGIGRLVIHTGDASHPQLVLEGMQSAEWLRDTLNRAVIDIRERKGMREITMGYA
ncbi:PH domain-containing protein [Dyella sp. BiH032]|uniref:PH domain-containing protein n=1 Tax=Dyella sp. BiH032 TaxID=3075430 RepID=UPI0028935956|nr:PH domain-containing protein [Dyella sp. BiH032]WNL46363.1 PH domain-containing protein [Dyella sp. BiH032]